MKLNIEEIKNVARNVVEAQHSHQLQFIFFHKNGEMEPLMLPNISPDDLAYHNSNLRDYVNKRGVKEYVMISEAKYFKEQKGNMSEEGNIIMVCRYTQDMYHEIHIMPFTITGNTISWGEETQMKKGDGSDEVSHWNFYIEDCFDEKFNEMIKDFRDNDET